MHPYVSDTAARMHAAELRREAAAHRRVSLRRIRLVRRRRSEDR